ncbi:MAG: hypothetical protein ACLQVI_42565 [Polyangiaceae bacterium]
MARDDVGKLTSVQSLGSQESDESGGSSGVYIVERESAPLPEVLRSRGASAQKKARKAMNPLLDQVTLVVYGWKSVEPGTLSWVFPSVTAAVSAARAMKNAVRWAIVAGRRENDSDEGASVDGRSTQDDALDEARANGSVLIEQAG